MNDCGRRAVWAVVGAAVTSDGEAINLVLGSCERHLLGVKAFVDDRSADLDESAVVCGIEMFRVAIERQYGLPMGTVVEAVEAVG